MSVNNGVTYRFGRFVLDVGERRLSRDGVPLPLPPTPFDTLLYLVERNGHLVTKDELLEQVWQGTVVSESSLTSAIRDLRRTLGDDARQPRFIETRPRVGYTFVAEVEVVNEVSTEETTDAVVARPNVWRRMMVWAGIGCALLVVGAYTAALLRSRQAPGGVDVEAHAVEKATPRIVVLPFVSVGSEEQEYFAYGLTEELTSRLATVGGLDVIARQSAYHYEGSTLTAAEIGGELGVGYLLEGSVRWAGEEERIRVSAQLIEVEGETHLWAETYDMVVDSVFEVQSSIARRVAEQLGLELVAPGVAQGWQSPTENLDAYQAYLLGRYLARKPHFSRENQEDVVRQYQLAVELDPEFTAAWSELSKAHSRLYFYRGDTSPERAALARDAAARVTDLAAASPEAHLATAYVHLWVDREPEPALEELTAAARYLPDSVEILAARSLLLRLQGRWQENLRQLERAVALSPRDPSLAMDLAETYWVTRQYEKALTWCRKTTGLVPDPSWRSWPYLYEGFVNWMWDGNLEKAREAFLGVDRTHDWWPWVWFWQELYEGDSDGAVQILDGVSSGWIEIKIAARPVSLLKALVFEEQGDEASARQEFIMAREELESVLGDRPDDPRLHSSLGIALAGLGEAGQAISEGQRAKELLPESKDAFYGLPYVIDLAHIHTLLGQEGEALDLLEHLLSVPSWMSPSYIQMDPRWRRLEGNPRFQTLLAGAVAEKEGG